MDVTCEKQLEEFFKNHRRMSYAKGEIIHRPGDLLDSIDFVISGYVRMYKNSADGKEITLNLFKPLMYMSLLYGVTGKENTYYFKAHTPVELWRAPKDLVIAFIKTHPDLHFWITTKILNVLGDTLDHVEKTISGDSTDKLFAIIKSLARQFGVEDGDRIQIDFEITQDILASLTGLTRETVSAKLAKLYKLGVISKIDKFIVVEK